MSGGFAELPTAVHSAAMLLNGWYGPLDLGRGIRVTPAEYGFRDSPRAGWRPDREPPTWWLIEDETREYGYSALGRRNWDSAKALLVYVHSGVENSQHLFEDNEHAINVLLEDGIDAYRDRHEDVLEAYRDLLNELLDEAEGDGDDSDDRGYGFA